MTTIRLELDGMSEFMAALQNASEEAVDEVSVSVTKTALDVDKEIKRLMQSSPASGRVYKRGKGRNRSAVHQASSPGQPPAVDSGGLLNSVTFRQVNALTAEVVAVGPGSVYARRLEFGGTDSRGVYIAPRPAWRPAVEKAEPRFKRRLEDALRKAFR